MLAIARRFHAAVFAYFLVGTFLPAGQSALGQATSGQATSGQDREHAKSVKIDHGQLSVTFQDNSESPGKLSGIQSLFNTQHAPDHDAYDPDGAGASAGLNFEHIISGHRSRNNAFTPRQGKYSLHKLSDGRSVELLRRAEDSPWRVESTLKYTIVEPNYIDFEFRCKPRDASLFGERGYALFFFANYMNDVQDAALNFRGRKDDGEEEWIKSDAPAGPPDWVRGGNFRAVGAEPLDYDTDVRFRLNTWSYDSPRISKPFFYGRAAKDMTMILMFDRLSTERDQIRFSLYKFKLPNHPRPAWDFQYVVNRVQSDQEYGFRGRLVWKKFMSPEDCLAEYGQWAASLESKDAAHLDEQVQELKKIGATVFVRDKQVIEVNANRTEIKNDDLGRVSDFTSLTDLSLENTQIGDAGIAHLALLQKLEWLNLYQTKLGDDGLRTLAQLRSLQHLPIGETQVTDAGLKHLSDMNQLLYLGLRDNAVTDEGVKSLQTLPKLTGLHLGGTQVTDKGVNYLVKLPKLEKLWLDETAVTDKSVATLGKLTTLKELHVAKTKISAQSLENLRILLPRCQVIR